MVSCMIWTLVRPRGDEKSGRPLENGRFEAYPASADILVPSMGPMPGPARTFWVPGRADIWDRPAPDPDRHLT
jgi:hypothetical protein